MIPSAACLVLAFAAGALTPAVAALVGTPRRPPLGRLLAPRRLRVRGAADGLRGRASRSPSPRDDFSLQGRRRALLDETPTFYKLAAMWSSQEGSLLLWAWVLSIASSRGPVRDPQQAARDRPLGDRGADGPRRLLHRPDAVRDASTRSPGSAPVPADGVGLNPLLRHPSMMIHPPMLYSGYVAFTIPFAFAIGALITRRLDASWIRSTRRFALIAWTFLGSASCSAPAGPTPSSAGAATGPGTRSRTRR